MQASQRAGNDYLTVLIRVIRGKSEKDALDRLRTVRVAIAQYFARCSVLDGGVGL